MEFEKGNLFFSNLSNTKNIDVLFITASSYKKHRNGKRYRKVQRSSFFISLILSINFILIIKNPENILLLFNRIPLEYKKELKNYLW